LRRLYAGNFQCHPRAVIEFAFNVPAPSPRGQEGQDNETVRIRLGRANDEGIVLMLLRAVVEQWGEKEG
jgi:hypothetical protein